MILPPMRYVRALAVNPTVPPGTVLVHNQVQHTPGTPNGLNGFRAWTQRRTRRLIRCRCGWAPRVPAHYRVRPELLGTREQEPATRRIP